MLDAQCAEISGQPLERVYFHLAHTLGTHPEDFCDLVKREGFYTHTEIRTNHKVFFRTEQLQEFGKRFFRLVVKRCVEQRITFLFCSGVQLDETIYRAEVQASDAAQTFKLGW